MNHRLNLRPWICVLAFCIAGPTALRAQTTVADTSSVDSLRSRIIGGLGASAVLSGRTVAERDRWQWLPVRSIVQVVDGQAGRFVRSVGESGADVGTSWLGGSAAHDAWSLDGLPTGDPLTGRAMLTLAPLEQLEAVEQLSDEEATLTGSRWNLVTRQYSTVRPITAVRFVQEPDETILSDGSFAQNVARSTALTFGFQRHTSAGRFANAALDAWHLRGRLRANVSEHVNVAAFWHYARSSRGVNGGVDPALSPSIFDDISAVVRHSAAYEIREQTDLGLMGILRLFDDSLATTRIGLVQRASEREYRQMPDLFSTTDLRQFARAKDLVVSVEQLLRLPFLTFAAAGQVGSTHLDSTEVLRDRDASRSRWSAAGALTFIDWLTPRAAVALVKDDGEEMLEYAGSITIVPLGGLEAKVSVHRRPLFPTLQERFWSDSTVFRSSALSRGEERILTAEIAWSLDRTIEVWASGFRREQRDVVIVRPALTLSGTPSIALTQWSPTWNGVAAAGRFGFYGFELSGAFTWAKADVADTLRSILPQWWGQAEVAYQARVFREQLGFRTGVRTRFSDRLRGLSPDPPTGLEVANTTMLIGRAVTVDVYGTMEIGQAFLSLSWENLTDASALRTAVYPMPGRQVKLGVRWVFAD